MRVVSWPLHVEPRHAARTGAADCPALWRRHDAAAIALLRGRCRTGFGGGLRGRRSVCPSNRACTRPRGAPPGRRARLGAMPSVFHRAPGQVAQAQARVLQPPLAHQAPWWRPAAPGTNPCGAGRVCCALSPGAVGTPPLATSRVGHRGCAVPDQLMRVNALGGPLASFSRVRAWRTPPRWHRFPHRFRWCRGARHRPRQSTEDVAIEGAIRVAVICGLPMPLRRGLAGCQRTSQSPGRRATATTEPSPRGTRHGHAMALPALRAPSAQGVPWALQQTAGR